MHVHKEAYAIAMLYGWLAIAYAVCIIWILRSFIYCFVTSASDGFLIRRALQEILDSTLTSPLAVSARETASKLLQWSLDPANNQEFCLFSKELISTLQKSAKELEDTKRSLAARREKMWSGFHILRTNTSYSLPWKMKFEVT